MIPHVLSVISGSRLHRNSLISRARSQSSRRSDISHATQQDDVPVTPSTRPSSLRLSARFSVSVHCKPERYYVYIETDKVVCQGSFCSFCQLMIGRMTRGNNRVGGR